MLTKNEKNTTRIIILAAGTLLHTFSPVLIFLKCCSNVIYNLHILFAGKNPIDWYGEKKARCSCYEAKVTLDRLSFVY